MPDGDSLIIPVEIPEAIPTRVTLGIPSMIPFGILEIPP